jgi:hypothetical protein
MANAQNLIPATKGEIRNPNGRPKGSKNLTTITKELLLNDINFDLLTTPQAKEIAMKFNNKSAWEAVVYIALDKALTGDVRAMDWLTKALGKEMDKEPVVDYPEVIVKFI